MNDTRTPAIAETVKWRLAEILRPTMPVPEAIGEPEGRNEIDWNLSDVDSDDDDDTTGQDE